MIWRLPAVVEVSAAIDSSGSSPSHSQSPRLARRSASLACARSAPRMTARRRSAPVPDANRGGPLSVGLDNRKYSPMMARTANITTLQPFPRRTGTGSACSFKEGRTIHPSRGLAPLLLVALGVLLILPSSALAATDKVIRNDYSGSASGTTCAVSTVDASYAGSFRATISQLVIGPPVPGRHLLIGNINDHGPDLHQHRQRQKRHELMEQQHQGRRAWSSIGNGDWQYTFSRTGCPCASGTSRSTAAGS